MLPLRFARHWRAASVILLVLVLAGTLMPAFWAWPDDSDLTNWLLQGDKWMHALTFLFLAVWFAGQYRPQAYWRIAIGLLLFGALIEMSQGLVEYRSAEWLDMVANIAGIGVGLTAALVGLGGWCLWLEERLVRSAVESSDD
jgi:VanZ family protein